MQRIVIATFVLFLTTPALAQKTLTDGIRDLASQISASTTKEQKQKVAVVPFRELDGQTTVLGTYLAEELVTHLVNSGLHVVERGMLDKLLGEQKLQQSGAIDPDTAKTVGKITGVDAIVTGSVTDLASLVGINCRLIETQTGNIFAAAQTKITKDDDVKKIMGVVLVTAGGSGGAAPAPQKTKAAASKPYLDGDVRVTVEDFQRNGSVITAYVVAENTGSSPLGYYMGPYRLVDDNGDFWPGRIDANFEFGYETIAPGTRRRIKFTFRPEKEATGTVFALTATRDGKLIARNLTPAP